MSGLRPLFTTNKIFFTHILHSKCVQRSVTLALWRHKSTDKENSEEDAPIRYSTSRAGSWTARQSRVGTRSDEDIPWFQPYAITLSLGIFLLYFCVLREENDVDEELGRTLYDRIDGLEKKQLEISLQYNLDNNIDVTDIKNRLAEIEQESK